MSTALIVGHPDLGNSRINAALTNEASAIDSVDVRVLSQLYPDGAIDLAAEQQALSAADTVVLQYPTYWYSPPSILKCWLDNVLVRGWAYGTGTPGALAGKGLRIVTSTGGTSDGYRDGGLHSYPYDAMLVPLQATAHRLGMKWREPLVVHGIRDIDGDGLVALRATYRALLLVESGNQSAA